MFLISALLTSGGPRRPWHSPLAPRFRRFLSLSSQHSTIDYSLSHPIYMIWGSNTGLGKTLVSAGLAASSILSPSSSSSSSSFTPTNFTYLKPVQTGFPADSDSAFVYRKFAHVFASLKPALTVSASNYVFRTSIPAAEAVLGNAIGVEGEECVNSLNGFTNLGWYEERMLHDHAHGQVVAASELICKTMYGWREPVSPHLAAKREGAELEDSELLQVLKMCLGSATELKCEGKMMTKFTVVETAGGVASPGPSGSLQCDLYRPFRLPAILVGDGRLGGISGTISAYESLKIRGYDVVAIVLEDHGLVNEVPLSSYLHNRVPVLVLPPVPQDMSDDLVEWFDQSRDIFNSLKEKMIESFLQRKNRVQEMPKKAKEVFWWPFTQHKLVPEESVTVIDSRCGEHFAVHKIGEGNLVTQQFDACASWWTQGPDQSLQIELAREVGYATARFGHVMFPENVYEPALECAELLLEGVGKGWASRVFYSDNGSTAIEIALKMAFRKFLVDHGILLDMSRSSIDENHIELKVLALKGSYHGDTLGAMEAQAPSSYTGILQQPWYQGRGHFVDPPTVSLQAGVWKLSLPKVMQYKDVSEDDKVFSLQDEIFNKKRDISNVATHYLSYISEEIFRNSDSKVCSHIAALIIEPVIQGAGGMLMIDPLFQRLLVKECKSRKVPVIFDEVFTGLWRLGVESAATLLECQPDIACYAKLLTGGIVPLAATLATDAVFNSFIGDSKLKALLHGHSYSAHAIGCTAAAKSIKWFKNRQKNSNLSSDATTLREFWDGNIVKKISKLQTVDRVVALGTLCAVELRAEGFNSGYGSLYTTSLIQKLRQDGIYMRPLGNVIYLLCGPCTSPLICQNILEKVFTRLDEIGESH
ncbi:bifunctional dethiobiotin synthetase/7,8-diamino-pelargonic acid aminotransferase, mitochondrial [Impatiens glandulifera]|uniref:bifunctional dethiobiotin synthetase/7,8-diamino-pelargonic acid aminotransferase, mitochondrial n=1 Tax=Impatiens glandulifera TaxID=253017 RepID=UPI001FB107D8|nr:bifunctional dethiobiotin synthetase/7,8-diamino-pelargonic acid aminotransferase, mitochondrial [Impatiens glandulifera]